MANDIWTVGRILAWIEGYLSDHGDAQARLSAQWLVAEALGVSRMQLFLDLERPLTADERSVLRDWTRRRATGEPLQYITGEVAFRHITVKVERGVLIPRPETEVLVSEALALLPAASKPQDAFDDALVRAYGRLQASEKDASAARGNGFDPSHAEAFDLQSSLLVADICTGTGCIACSIASEHPAAQVVATDIAPVAVDLARRNVAALGLGNRVEVLQGDLGDAVPAAMIGSFDLVVSNPPYIPTAALAQLETQVADFEPKLALDGGADGLDVFRRLLDWAHAALRSGGGLAVELHETCLDDAAAEAEYAGFENVRTVADLAGRPRVLIARRR